ncbi:hypothetical protein DFH09DRAFT_1265101 [Mycena vulgaris]|nr:hypothetical protein DFH09DRAFT_1265101 [Mycena vulgaris]
MPALLARDDVLSPSSSLGPTYIAGIALCGVIVLSLSIWLAAKREKIRIAAFTRIHGVYKEDAEKEPLPENLQAIGGNTFSRDQLTRSVVLPEKVLTRPTRGATNEDILDFHRQSGTLNNNRFSVISSSSSVDSTPTAGLPRKTRQLFNPVLPDELLLSLGERLTVVQSFDDGWVVVGRSTGGFAASAKSMFKSSSGAPAESDVELGVVPAWCFLKPVKGLRAERPVRSTSLGITVQMDGPSFSSRDEILSWSNF